MLGLSGLARKRFAAGLSRVAVMMETVSTCAGSGLERNPPPEVAEMVTRTVALLEAFPKWHLFPAR